MTPSDGESYSIAHICCALLCTLLVVAFWISGIAVGANAYDPSNCYEQNWPFSMSIYMIVTCASHLSILVGGACLAVACMAACSVVDENLGKIIGGIVSGCSTVLLVIFEFCSTIVGILTLTKVDSSCDFDPSLRNWIIAIIVIQGISVIGTICVGALSRR